jgi:DNA-binding response OmpR family regulator
MDILVADDSVDTTTFLAAALRAWGHTPHVVTDGLAALAVLEGPDPPRMALLDWLMPGMDGVAVCRVVRSRPSPAPPYIILVTGCDSTRDIVTGLDAGAHDYVVKPFDVDELRARVRVGERVVALQQALRQRVEELERALLHVKTLQGILPICSHCHRIRDDKESWQRLEAYLAEHADVLFSHGICPDCLEKHYPQG